jgi:hypothetical protein
MLIRGVEFDGTDEASFQRKQWELSSDLPSRRQRYWKRRKAGLGFKVLVLLLVAVAGYYVTDNTQLGDGSWLPATLKRQTILEGISKEKSAAASHANPPEPHAAVSSETSLSVNVPFPAAALAKARSSEEAIAPAVLPGEILPLAADPVSTVVPLIAPKDAVAAAPQLSSPVTPPSVPVRITQSLACRSVEARRCIGKRSVFTLHEHNSPYIWMNVYSQALPYVLKHIYYHDGEKYVEIPLTIKYPRTRTWSNVTLQSPTHVGSWQVAIVTEDGDLLDQVKFQVVP